MRGAIVGIFMYMNLLPLSLSLFVSYHSSFAIHHTSRLVEETLTPLDPDRRAFRLVGGVLVSLIMSNSMI